jgi:hypothetical protein
MPNAYQPSNTWGKTTSILSYKSKAAKGSPSPKTSVLLKDYGKRNNSYFPSNETADLIKGFNVVYLSPFLHKED